MNKRVVKAEFVNELMFFSGVSRRDLNSGLSLEEVEDALIRYSSSFYGARIDLDQYAIKKCHFIATYAEQIIKGDIIEKDINAFLDEIIEDEQEMVM